MMTRTNLNMFMIALHPGFQHQIIGVFLIENWWFVQDSHVDMRSGQSCIFVFIRTDLRFLLLNTVRYVNAVTNFFVKICYSLGSNNYLFILPRRERIIGAFHRLNITISLFLIHIYIYVILLIFYIYFSYLPSSLKWGTLLPLFRLRFRFLFRPRLRPQLRLQLRVLRPFRPLRCSPRLLRPQSLIQIRISRRWRFRFVPLQGIFFPWSPPRINGSRRPNSG